MLVSFGLLTKGAGHIGAALRHNRREIERELDGKGNIDPSRSYLNLSLTPDEKSSAGAARAAQLIAHLTPRKNAARGLEVVFSLSPTSNVDYRAYFTDCVAWACDQFGGRVNLISADVHLDEGSPHCHALFVPLRDGKLAGSAMLGNRENIHRLRESFTKTVANPYGVLVAPRLKGNARARLAEAVVSHLRRNDDPVMKSAAWNVVRATIYEHPEPWAECYGIELANAEIKPSSSFVGIMTGTGRRTIEDNYYRESQTRKIVYRETIPEANSYSEASQNHSLSCVGNGVQTIISTTKDDTESEYTRVRDEEQLARIGSDLDDWPPAEPSE